MPDDFNDLNSHLQREFSRRDQEQHPDGTDSAQDSSVPIPVSAEPVSAELMPHPDSTPTDDIEREQLGMINKLRLRNARSAHELEKARTAYRTEMQLLQHQADAAIRESRAFWDAKSVEVAETIKTYVQSTVRALEIDRLDSRNADMQRAYESAAVAMENAKNARLPEVMKDRLIRDILDNFDNTLKRIQNDTIVARYDLD